MLTSRIASHLRALHLATPRPITDPCPALRCSGLTANLPSIIYDDFPSSQQGYYGCGYPGGRLWEPNTYSLGPAPAVLAGAEAVGAVTAIVPTQVCYRSMGLSCGLSRARCPLQTCGLRFQGLSS
jgi:hypothetical protein